MVRPSGNETTPPPSGDGGLRIFGPEHPSWVRFPDVAYHANGTFPNDRPPEGWSEEIPALVVEVVSPNDTARDIEDKVQMWLKAGVATVWVAHPEMRVVVVRKPGNTITFLQREQLVTDVSLPGFGGAASDFFPPISQE